MKLQIDNKARTSRDITLVLLHANGTPRSFRIPIASIKRFLLLTGSCLLVLFLLSVVLAGQSLKRWVPSVVRTASEGQVETPIVDSEAEPAQGTGATPAPAPFAEPALTGFRVAHVPSLFSGALTLLPESQVQIKVQNPSVVRDAASGKITFRFDIAHLQPDAGIAVRGFIVVLLRSPLGLFFYPETLMSPRESVLLNHARGESFGVSRFRQVQAEFKNLPKGLPPAAFQVLLFTHEGRVILSSLYEEKR